MLGPISHHQQDRINILTTAALLSEHSTVCYVGGWRASRMRQIKARVADRSECGSLEAGCDNGREGTQVTPAEWKAVTYGNVLLPP